jgi:hypothetical protein
MNATGARWAVTPHGFLVHRPHAESRPRKEFLKAKFSRKDMQAGPGARMSVGYPVGLVRLGPRGG